MDHVTHHFCVSSHRNTTKNKLDAAFQDYLYSLTGRLVSHNKFEDLKTEILEKAKELNEKFPRCKSLQISFWRPGLDRCYIISGFYGIDFKIWDAQLNNSDA